MDGLFSEHGLYHVTPFSSPPALYLNPFSWANFSNSLFIEAPAGVGFSYCTTRAGCSHTDTSTAADNLAALRDFFTTKFPELAANDFWIAGESYAGIYVPSLAYAVYNYNVANPAAAINLQGILVGNGCIGNAAGHCGNDPTGLSNYHDVMQWRGHGLLPETTYDAIMTACDWPAPSLECDALLALASLQIGNLDVYDIYNTCSDPAITRRVRAAGAPASPQSLTGRVLARRAAEAAGLEEADTAAAPARVGIDPNCFDTTQTLQSWANQAEVKAALHVAPSIVFELCSGNSSFNYNGDIADERTVIYPTLTQAAGYKVLVFNGEADMCVPYTDNEWWTRSMNYSVVAPWHSWSVPGDTGPYVGGYAINYAHNFTFATVRGAGHMVPQTRPAVAQELFRRHISGEGF
jgi:serine carboxypeptidase-like clade I